MTSTTIEYPTTPTPERNGAGHQFSSVPELNASGRGIDHRLHTSHRVSCSCGAAWTFKTDEIAARVTGNHLRRVSR